MDVDAAVGRRHSPRLLMLPRIFLGGATATSALAALEARIGPVAAIAAVLLQAEGQAATGAGAPCCGLAAACANPEGWA